MSKKKIISYLAVIFFLVALALSLDFIAVKADHDCSGDGCQICAVLTIADDVIGGGKKAEPNVSYENTPSYNAESLCLSETENSVAADSPVTRCDILTI